MPRRIALESHCTQDDLEARHRRARDPVERSRWRFLWLLAHSLTATAVAGVTGYWPYWIGAVIGRGVCRQSGWRPSRLVCPM